MNGRLLREEKLEAVLTEKLSNDIPSLNEWNLVMKASNKSVTTRSDYIYVVSNFLNSIGVESDDDIKEKITRSAVLNHMVSIQTKKDKDGNTVQTSGAYHVLVWVCLNSFFEFLVLCGKLSENYMKIIDKPSNKDLDRINQNRVQLTEHDFNRILYSVKKEKNPKVRARDKAILELLMNTGMRKSALTTIMLEDVDLEERKLRVVDKGEKYHTYRLNDKLAAALENWLEVRDEVDDAHLFLSNRGNGISSQAVTLVVGKYTKRALGKELSPHKLRAGFCSIMYDKTHDIEFVRRAVGHSDINTTQRYIVTGGSERDQAAEIMNGILY